MLYHKIKEKYEVHQPQCHTTLHIKYNYIMSRCFMLSFFGWIMQNSATGHDFLIYKPFFLSKNNDIVIHAITMT